jgi:hypothetical protein
MRRASRSDVVRSMLRRNDSNCLVDVFNVILSESTLVDLL